MVTSYKTLQHMVGYMSLGNEEKKDTEFELAAKIVDNYRSHNN